MQSDSVRTSAATGSRNTLVGGLLAQTDSQYWRSHLSTLTSPDRYALRQPMVFHSDGLCSSVYRYQLDSTAVWPYTLGGTSATAEEELYGGMSGWVCIKRVQVEEQPSPHSVQLELELLDRLGPHVNIVPLLAAFCDTTDPFGTTLDLVMPLYPATLTQVLQEPSLVPGHPDPMGNDTTRPGNSLRHLWTAESSPSASADTLADLIHSTTYQLLSALAFLQQRGVAHRDVKPSNILLAATGQVKLIDFGTASTFDPLVDPSSRAKVCQVGTGIFRAPELLFSPKHGYDACAVDIWAVGVTIAHFFLPLTDVRSPPSIPPREDIDDERPDWQRALEDQLPLTETQEVSPSFWQEEFAPTPSVSSASGYVRAELFDAERGDISLAAGIFTLLGLPTVHADWPESIDFQPPLHRLPFAPRTPQQVNTALPLYNTLLKDHPATSPAAITTLMHIYNQVLVPAIQLSASKRPTASHMLAQLTPPQATRQV